MINKRWRLVKIALALAAAMVFVSCSDDDGGGDSGGAESHEDNYNDNPTYDVGTIRGKVLYYLHSMQAAGKTLAGQMDLTWDDSVDMDAKVYSAVREHPAIMGYDFMNELCGGRCTRLMATRTIGAARGFGGEQARGLLTARRQTARRHTWRCTSGCTTTMKTRKG